MSLEGTKEIPTFPGNSRFSFVSGGEKRDSKKHYVFLEKKTLQIIYSEEINDFAYLFPTEE